MQDRIAPEENPRAVESELARILRSSLFARAERQRRFLTFIVAETLAGRGNRISGYSIGIEVFDRDDSFDPIFDPIVRVGAARLRAKLREYYDGEGATSPIRIGLDKGSYAVKIYRWTEVPDMNVPGTHEAFATKKHGRASLLVVPFSSDGAPDESHRFADGLIDDLITDLSMVPGLSLMSRHASLQYTDSKAIAALAASNVKPDLLLEGSVRFDGDAVRVSVQLVDAASSLTLWGARYDRERSGEFAAQDALTTLIVDAVRAELVHLRWIPTRTDFALPDAPKRLVRSVRSADADSILPRRQDELIGRVGE